MVMQAALCLAVKHGGMPWSDIQAGKSHLCKMLNDPEQRCYQGSQKDDVSNVKHHCTRQLPIRKSITGCAHGNDLHLVAS